MRRFSRQVVECVIILVLLEEKIKRPAWRSDFPHEQGGSRILHVIPVKRKNIFAGESRPTRARGLKHSKVRPFPVVNVVAPHAGAWIETELALERSHVPWSRPTRARGLKRRRTRNKIGVQNVAPHAGAWIETASRRRGGHGSPRRAPRGRGD